MQHPRCAQVKWTLSQQPVAAAAVPFFLAGRSAIADDSVPESTAAKAKGQRFQKESSIWVIDNVLVLTSRR